MYFSLKKLKKCTAQLTSSFFIHMSFNCEDKVTIVDLTVKVFFFSVLKFCCVSESLAF